MKYINEFKKSFESHDIYKSLVKSYGEKIDDVLYKMVRGKFTHSLTTMAYHTFLCGIDVKSHHDKVAEDQQRYIKKCIKKHGDKFDYSTIEFDGSFIKVYCNTHKGFIEARRLNHLTSGCKICYHNSRRMDIDVIKSDFEYIWQGIYDYSQFKEYTGALVEIPIICKIHGVFHLTPSEHRSGSIVGCGECYRTNRNEYIKMKHVAQQRSKELLQIKGQNRK